MKKSILLVFLLAALASLSGCPRPSDVSDSDDATTSASADDN